MKSKLAAAVAFTLMAASQAAGEGFIKIREDVISVLSKNSGNEHIWIRRDYRSPSGIKLRAEILKGKSFTAWEIPLRPEEGTDAPLGFGGTYVTLTLNGNATVAVETHPMWGVSVVGKREDSVVTVEAPLEARGEALELAEELLNSGE
ncbi:MAG: hypothetical protein N2315_01325 [Thermanaerothrix sp.]|nr:hypothetical protein [Thermanaerothrix sp.]